MRLVARSVDLQTELGDSTWYEAGQSEVADKLFATVRAIHNADGWRLDKLRLHRSMYGSRTVSPGEAASKYESATLPDNICRSMVDTLTSKVAKHRPLPRVLSSHGSYRTQRRARKMTQFLEGVFDEQKVFAGLSANVVRSAASDGCSLAHVYRDGKRIHTDRVNASECFVDPYDAEYGKPRCMYRTKRVDRGVLVRRAKTREQKDAILSASSDEFDKVGAGMTSTVRRVSVVEGWRLPDGEADDKGKYDIPGRHTVAVQGCVIHDEDYHWDSFPLIELNYSDPVEGFFGTGLIEQLEGYQYELDLANERLSDAYQLTGALLDALEHFFPIALALALR